MKKFLKIILIVIGVLFLLFIGLVINDFIIEDKLNKIVNELANQEVINMKIETSGDYAKVEKAIKTDYNDFYKLVDKIINEYGNPILDKCLSASNYTKDGPDFINTRAELDQLKLNRKKLNYKILEIVSDESIRAKIAKYNLDEYYADLYKKYIADLKLIIDDVIKEDVYFNDSIDVVIEILDFLQEEKNSWIIEDNKILFEDQDLLDKYNWLVNKICEDCQKEDVPTI